MPKEPHQTVLISGYYGFGNSGDEAVLAGILEQLTSLWPKAEYIALSGDPAQTTGEHGIRAVHRRDVKGVLAALRASTVFISGGGTLFQDVTSFRSLYYYLFMILVARWYRLPVIVYGQGIGPFRFRLNRCLTLWVLRQTHLVIVRDIGAYNQLLALGFDKHKLHLGADPVLALKPMVHTLGEDRARSMPMLEKGKSVLFVSLRPWPQLTDNLSKVASALDYMYQKGWQVVFIPFQFKVDYPVCQACARLMKGSALVWSKPLAAKDMLALFSEADYCLGMRLHALIFSAVHKVPMLGLAYDPKVSEFMGELGLEKFAITLSGVVKEPINVEDLINGLELLEAERDNLIAQIGDKVDKMANRLMEVTSLMEGRVGRY